MKDPLTPKLADVDAERARRRIVECIVELQSATFVRGRIVANVSLAAGVATADSLLTIFRSLATPIAHKLGRAPVWVSPSAPRGPVSAGFIEEVLSGSNDRAETIILKATGYGATITVDVGVA